MREPPNLPRLLDDYEAPVHFNNTIASIDAPYTRPMPHPISHSVFARTSLTICDNFVMALSYLEPRRMMSPEELIASASPWFLDAETVWWRKFWMDS